jgi:hypothetical protein
MKKSAIILNIWASGFHYLHRQYFFNYCLFFLLDHSAFWQYSRSMKNTSTSHRSELNRQTVSQAVSQSVSESVSQSVCQSVSQSVSQSGREWVATQFNVTSTPLQLNLLSLLEIKENVEREKRCYSWIIKFSPVIYKLSKCWNEHHV